MLAILAVTVPFFALVLCGYLAAARGVIPEAAIPGLNAFVLFFALPCLLFRFGAGLPVIQLLHPAILGVYLVSGVVVVGLTLAAARRRGLGPREAAFGALVAAFPNTGFMGVPLLTALVGPQAAGPVVSTVLVDLFVTSSLCLGLAQLDGGSAGASAWQAAVRSLRGAAGNPLPWAIGLGALASLTALRLPGPVDAIVTMLAHAATPVALFTIGTVLWRAGRRTVAAAPGGGDGAIVVAKLLLHPLIVWSVGRLAQRLGLPLADEPLRVLVLAAALPSASSVSLLAERYGADNGRIARIVMLSTALAFASFSTLAWLYDVDRALAR